MKKIKNKKYFLYITIAMGVFLLFVFLLAKFNFGEYILLIYWFYICGKNIHGYFYDGRMFAFGGADVSKGENNDEARVFFLYMTLILYFVLLSIILFTYWRI